MSNYLPTIRFETEYEGDTVAVEMSALTRKAFVSMMPKLNEAKTVDGNKMAVYDVACEILNDHIENVSGLRDKNGNALGKDVLIGSVYFVDLVTEAFNKLIQECSLEKMKSTDLEVKSPESTAEAESKTSH